MKRILFLLPAILFSANVARSQDTTIFRRVTFELGRGLRFDSTFVFSLQKPKPDTLFKERVVYRTDTVFVYDNSIKPTPIPKGASLKRSAFPSLQAWLDSAVGSGAMAILDRDDTIRTQLVIRGDITLYGNGRRLHNALSGAPAMAPYAILLESGTHRISHLVITQTPTGRCFGTTALTGIRWHNVFSNVNVLSGYTAYESSRGGTEDRWALTEWKNSVLQVATVAISIFSQDGPWKALHLDSVAIYNGPDYGDITVPGRPAGHLTHTLYAHPNVSLRLDSVTLYAGGLGLHHFSGGGVPGINDYTIFRRVYSRGNSLAPTIGGTIEIRPGKDSTIIDQSDFALHGSTVPMVKATNSIFSNRGSGSFMQGTLINCSGVVMPSAEAGPVHIFGGNISELDFRQGGTAVVEGAYVANVWASPKEANYTLVLKNSRVDNVAGDISKGNIQADKATSVKRSNVAVAKKEFE